MSKQSETYRNTPKKRRQQRREERLVRIDQQVEDGTLVIRKMTAAERKRFPAKDKA